MLSNAGATALARALQKNSAIKELNLKRNRIGDAGATTLEAALEHRSTQLSKLVLEANRISDELLNRVYLASGVCKRGNVMGAGGGRLNSVFIPPRCLSLDLSEMYDQMGDAGAIAVAKALEGNAAVTSLLLYDTNMGDDGAAALAVVLEGNAVINSRRPLWQHDQRRRCG